MTELAVQPSMFDLGHDEPRLGRLAGRIRRHRLTRGAWVDHFPGWVEDSDSVLRVLLDDVPWRAERRQMYDNEVDVPRLLSWYGPEAPLPHGLLTDARERLSAHYADELGEPFVTAGLCLYRDGHDSVAWHGDRIGRSATEDTMVAIVSFGSPRPLMLRPRGGGMSDAERRRASGLTQRSQCANEVGARRGGKTAGKGAPHRDQEARSLRFPVGHGDLIVMGGSCQRTWEHCVPKTTKAVGPRVSVQFRPIGVA